jgi:hypothetical protein
MTDSDYEQAKVQIEDFLRSYYVEDDDGMKQFKYMDQIGKLALREQIPLFIEQDDVYAHNPELYDWINGNTIRYRHLFCEVVQKLIQEVLGDNQVSLQFK